ncbi:MAG: DMT family transporter [Sphingobacteriaceae bacterium]|nr:DMT family transporter [Sphingobacteriaceae bacterium]
MVSVFLAVTLSVVLLVLFKTFPRFGVNTLVAIVFNYLFAFLSGYLFVYQNIQNNTVVLKPWMWWSIPLGVLFIAVFFLISKTAQLISIGTASISNKMSLVIPFLVSVLILDQSVTYLQLVGVILSLLAVYLASSKSEKINTKNLLLPFMVFLGSGLIDASLNLMKSFYINSNAESALFSALLFGSAFIMGMLTLNMLALNQKIKYSEIISLKNMLGGVLLGIPNYFSIYFIFKALDEGIMNSASLFPVLNVCNVALATLIGFIFFHEKLNKSNIAGIVMAILAIYLISS